MDEKNSAEVRKRTYQTLALGGKGIIRKLKGMEGHAQETNDALLREVLHKNAHTEFGIKYGFDTIKSYEEYAARVPLMEYGDYAPYIHNMSEDGRNNVLTSSKVDFYFSTAGTTGGSKLIPSSREQIRLITAYTNLYRYGMIADALGDIWTDGATLSPVEVRFDKTGSGVPCGCFSGKVFYDLGDMYSYATLSPKEAIFSESGEDTQYLHLLYALKQENVTEMNASYITWILEMMRRLEQNWEEFVRCIREGTLPQSLNLAPVRRDALLAALKPDPERADFLEQEFRKGFEEPILPRIWKKLAVVVAACGGTFAPYMQQFRRYIGDDIPFYCHGYTASEGVFGAPVGMNSTQMFLLPDSCFYEFQLFDEMTGAAAGAENGEAPVLRMNQLEAGRAYLVIITNKVGLYRYRMHDVIRVVDFRGSLPVFEMLYREDGLVSIAGEHISEDICSYAIFRAMKEQGQDLTGFSCYTDTAAKPRAGYVMMIEPAGDGPMPDPDALGRRIMDLMVERNVNIKMSWEAGWVPSPIVKYLKRGTYERYRTFKGDQGLGGNQIKPPQILRSPEQIGFFLSQTR